jgi:hypothetical protein
MARSESEVMIREIAKSSCMSFGTTAPFALGSIQITRIGFADIPVVQIGVTCRADCRGALVPIARAIVFKKLEAHGLESEILEFTPTVAPEGRQCMFTDENPSSESHGKRKRGVFHWFRFEIKKEQVGHFVWDWKHGKFPDTSE